VKRQRDAWTSSGARSEFRGSCRTIRIDLVGVRIFRNAISGFNETVEATRTTWPTFNVTLPVRQNGTRRYTFRISYIGLWNVPLFLFKDGDFASVYRGLHLYVTVR
jgi:hypothetical protein